MIKNIVTISLMIFIIAVVAILGAGVSLNQGEANNTPAQQQNNNTAGITLAEIAKHSTSSDCWMIISEKVYNVTDYINLHPAGPDTIIPYCGKDATMAFSTKGGRGSHSQRAQNMLNNYYVGNLTR